MKKRIAVLLCVILATALLAACAGASDHSRPNEAVMFGASNASAPMAPQRTQDFAMLGLMMEAAGYGFDDIDSSMFYESSREAAGSGIAGFASPDIEGFAEKIIYSVHANIEAVRFDETIAGINALIASYNAFIENSSVSGRNHASQSSGRIEYRNAHFTIRVPKEHLDAMTASLDGIGNVTHTNRNATNITAQFIDTQSRLNSLIVEQERLLEMISQAEDVPALIMIEERLSHVRYQIESLTTTLRSWQSQVDYSTLTLSIREVERYTEGPDRSYWQQIGDGFTSTMRGVGRFFMDLFRWLIVSAPVLVLLAVVAVLITIIVRKRIKTIAKKRASKPKPAPYQYPPVYGQNYAAPTAAPLTESVNQENENK